MTFAEETAAQVETAVVDTLDDEDLAYRLDARLLADLRAGTRTVADPHRPKVDGIPVPVAVSDSGPQMGSHATRQFMAAVQRFGPPAPRPTKPDRVVLLGCTRDLSTIPGTPQPDCARLHAGIGYAAPGVEHTGRGEALRKAARPDSRQPSSAGLPSTDSTGTVTRPRTPTMFG